MAWLQVECHNLFLRLRIIFLTKRSQILHRAIRQRVIKLNFIQIVGLISLNNIIWLTRCSFFQLFETVDQLILVGHTFAWLVKIFVVCHETALDCWGWCFGGSKMAIPGSCPIYLICFLGCLWFFNLRGIGELWNQNLVIYLWFLKLNKGTTHHCVTTELVILFDVTVVFFIMNIKVCFWRCYIFLFFIENL